MKLDMRDHETVTIIGNGVNGSLLISHMGDHLNVSGCNHGALDSLANYPSDAQTPDAVVRVSTTPVQSQALIDALSRRVAQPLGPLFSAPFGEVSLHRSVPEGKALVLGSNMMAVDINKVRTAPSNQRVNAMPHAVLLALEHVQSYHPDVVQVFFGVDNRWRYMDENMEAPEFHVGVNVSILEAASDAVPYLPVAYALEK